MIGWVIRMTDETKQVIDMMQELFSALNEKIDNSNRDLKDDIKDIKQRVIKIETSLENETNKNIQLLAEGFTPMAEDIHQLKDDMEVVKFDVDIVKKVVTTHSTELNQLRKVK